MYSSDYKLVSGVRACKLIIILWSGERVSLIGILERTVGVLLAIPSCVVVQVKPLTDLHEAFASHLNICHVILSNNLLLVHSS
jgi:hypothetical protein